MTNKFDPIHTAIVGNGDGREANIDAVTNAQVTTSFEHHEIHEGDHFFVRDFMDVAGSTTILFLLSVPDSDKRVHITIAVENEAEANFELGQTAVTSSDGTPVSTYNRDLASTNTAKLLIFTAPSVTSVAETVAYTQLGSAKKFGGMERDNEELILKPGTKYLFKVANITATDNLINYVFDWYEHTDNNKH